MIPKTALQNDRKQSADDAAADRRVQLQVAEMELFGAVYAAGIASGKGYSSARAVAKDAVNSARELMSR